jgi:hypothetical protein
MRRRGRSEMIILKFIMTPGSVGGEAATLLLMGLHIIHRKDPNPTGGDVLPLPPPLVTGIQHKDLLSFVERQLVISVDLRGP